MRLVSMLVVLACLSGVARAEEEVGQFRTAVSAVGGLSAGSSHDSGFGFGRAFGLGRDGGSGLAVGGVIAHDLSSRVTLEATGLYLDRDASAWSADAGFRLNLAPSSKSMVPYFAASGGVHSQRRLSQELRLAVPTLDARRGTLFGGRDGGREGDRRSFPITRGAVGMFVEEASARLDDGRRTDGLMTIGGGVVFAAGPRVFVRPDVRAQMVFSDDTHVFGLFTLSFGYRF